MLRSRPPADSVGDRGRIEGAPVAGRRDKMRGTQGRALETPEQMIERVMNAFARWLVEQAPGSHRNSVVLEVVRTACEFKSLSFGPNPADWPADVTAEVLGEVMPAR